MTMDKMENIREVTLKELWQLLLQRLGVMILAAAVAVTGLFLVNAATYEPMYSSTATMYILRQSDSDASSAGDVANDFSVALKVVNDCTYMLKSHLVLDQVIEQLELDMDYNTLYDSVSTANPEDTRILEVTVEANTPELAQIIVNKLCQIGPVEIAEAMGFEQINLFEYGTLSKDPCNRMGLMTYALVGICVAVLMYAVFLLMYLLDDRLRTAEDIEKGLGVSILGEIPDIEAPKPMSKIYGNGTLTGSRRKGGKKHG